MNELFAGFAFVVMGALLLLIYAKTAKAEKENTIFQTPYFKNGGIGFILFGLYYLVGYFLK